METKFYLTNFLLIFVCKLLAVQCEELVAIVIPKTIYKNSVFNVLVQAKDVTQNPELAIQFQESNRIFNIDSNNTYPLQYSTGSNIKKKGLNFTSTLYREKKKGLEIIQQCSTKTAEVIADKLTFYIFIQTDKPVYNPGEIVQFRIVIVDKDLRPFQINNINIEVIDPLNRTIERFTDLSNGQNLGIYIEKFKLGNDPLLGDWKIKATVEKQTHLATSKSFSVYKFNLPLFGVTIETSAKDYLLESILIITFKAGYAFGTTVAGRAELIIENIADGQIHYKKTFENVDGKEKVTINMKNNFNPKIESRVDLRATIIFTELESGLVYNKSTDFRVYSDSQVKVVADHPTEFTPGFPFDFKVFVQNWKNETVKTYDEVEMDYIFKLADGTRQKITFHPLLDNGTAEQFMMVPEDAIEFDIQCRFLNSRVYRVKVGKANLESVSRKLDIEYDPKNPQLTHEINVFVKSEKILGTIIVAIMTKHGNINTKTINCNFKIVCNFELEVKEEMIPKFTIEVYHVRHKNVVDYGSVEIITGNVGKNYLIMDLSKNEVEPKENITMTFTTTRNSRIFLLAVDRRLKYISDGNDLKRNDIMTKVGHFDSANIILVDDLTDWHTCTAEELLRLENGRRTIRSHASFGFDGDDVEDFSGEENGFDGEDGVPESIHNSDESEDEIDVKDLRELFPQTWLFETIQSPNISTEVSYQVPHSITSWHLSAFSVHDKMGLGIMRPKKLNVVKQFFIKFSLPYSLRYTEILKVDVLVFNYNKDNTEVNATVRMMNLNSEMFEFVEYVNCTPTFNTKKHSTIDIKVPSHDMKRVSFYIRSRPSDTDFTNEKKIKLRVFAKATYDSDKAYKDLVQKTLLIENFGVKLLDIDSVAYKLTGTRNSSIFQTNSNDSYTNSYCIVTGDFLSEKINLDSEFGHQSSDLLEHKVAKLKWNTNVYHYFESKNMSKSAEYFKQEYQDILTMRELSRDVGTTSGVTACLVDALTSAMDLKLIYEDSEVIEKELNILKDLQLESGEFRNFGKIPTYSEDNANYNLSKRYFETAFILISFLKTDKLVQNSYDDVIEKALDFLGSNTDGYENGNEASSIVPEHTMSMLRAYYL